MVTLQRLPGPFCQLVNIVETSVASLHAPLLHDRGHHAEPKSQRKDQLSKFIWPKEWFGGTLFEQELVQTVLARKDDNRGADYELDLNVTGKVLIVMKEEIVQILLHADEKSQLHILLIGNLAQATSNHS